MLMGSSTVCSICVLLVIVCNAQYTHHHQLGLAGISFVYVFLFAFAFVWTPMQALYPSEVLAYNARAKGLAMSGLWLNIVSFINTYAAPVGITRSGWKFYILYLAVDTVGIAFIYFFFIETKVCFPQKLPRLAIAKYEVPFEMYTNEISGPHPRRN